MPVEAESKAESTIKRRACDECRQKKLACSKDPDGCERCKRENIKCHYSEQKAMGRPRKRQFIEATQDEAEQDLLNGSQDPALLPFSADDFDFDAFLAEPYYTTTDQPASSFPDGTTDLRTTTTDIGRVIWHFGDREIMAGPPINFGDMDTRATDEILLPFENVPQLSNASNTSVTESENSPPQITAAPAPCSCLASMYLALASLQQFPTDIVAALAAVRGAASTAANSLWCPQCGSIILDSANSPIAAFQNTMLLGTILPIIANAYRRLLTMIDVETNEAVTAGATKTFRFRDYGGLGVRQMSMQQALSCADKELFLNEVEMPPAQWRTTVRALLRVDIYGLEQPGCKHKGLKDLVDEMEYRQRTRHDMIDAQIADGTLDPTKVGHGLFPDGMKCLGYKPRACIEMLRVAKIAIDTLVIA